MRGLFALVALAAATILPAGAAAAPHPSLVVATKQGSGPARHLRSRHDTRHLLVRFRPGTTPAARAAARGETGAKVDHVLSPERVEVLRLPPGASLDRAVARYRHDRRVEFAQPNHVYTIDATPNDTYFGRLWGLDNVGQSGGLLDADVDAPEAWDTLGLSAASGPWAAADFAVGVVDTGADTGHEDLAGKLVQPCESALTGTGTLTPGCTDDNGHGTHVTGTIAAVANNGKGIAGVAPQAKVFSCKALDATGSGFDADIAACMNDIVSRRDTNHIRVISLSLGGTDTSDVLEAAVEHAWANGVLVLAAAGNDGNSVVQYPAGYAHAVSVAATDRHDAHASFSNANADVELSAPGVSIVSTVPTYPTDPTDPAAAMWDPSGYASASGTSMATPHAAAIAALISWKTGKTGQSLRDALDAAVDDLGAPGRDPQFGYGRVNECLALGGACAYRGLAPPNPGTSSVPPGGGGSPGTAPTGSPPPSSKPPATVRTWAASGYRVLHGSVYRGRGALGRLGANDGRRLEITGRRAGATTVSDLYVVTSVGSAVRASLQRLQLVFDGSVSRAGSALRVSVYDWIARRWVSLRLWHPAPTADRTLAWTATSSARRYVSSAGGVRVRITGRRKGDVRTRTDLVRLTGTY